MDKAQALHAFWAGFDLPAYDESTVPEDAPFPRITYQVSTGSWDDAILLSASVWYYSRSWEAISQKADEIAAAIGWAGSLLPTDDGAIWLKRGSPFAQRMSDPNDMVRRILLNVVADYKTI